MNNLKHLTGVLFGAGLLPGAPGTWASLLVLPAIWFTAIWSGAAGVLFLAAAASLLSLWSAGECVKRYGDDPGRFVMDEAAGQSVAFLFIPFSGAFSHDFPILAAGFLLFRFFDILKPLGINQLQKLSGSFGILADDLLAGMYACIILHGILFFINTYNIF